LAVNAPTGYDIADSLEYWSVVEELHTHTHTHSFTALPWNVIIIFTNCMSYNARKPGKN